jgi:hypothetical protein
MIKPFYGALFYISLSKINVGFCFGIGSLLEIFSSKETLSYIDEGKTTFISSGLTLHPHH